MAMAQVNLKGNECVKHDDIMAASEMLAKIRQLNTVNDLKRSGRGGPTVQTSEELAEFCDVYNGMVKGYHLLT